MEQCNDSLEVFHNRLQEPGSHCMDENLEDDLVKDIFLCNMRSSNIQSYQKQEKHNRHSTTQKKESLDKRFNKRFSKQITIGIQYLMCHRINPGQLPHLTVLNKQYHTENLKPNQHGTSINCLAKNTHCNICKKGKTFIIMYCKNFRTEKSERTKSQSSPKIHILPNRKGQKHEE